MERNIFQAADPAATARAVADLVHDTVSLDIAGLDELAVPIG